MFAYYTSRAFGHWPTYGNPDPKRVEPRWLNDVVSAICALGCLLILVLPVGFIATHVVRHLRHRDHAGLRLPWALYLMGTIPWLIDYVALRTDGPSLINWLID